MDFELDLTSLVGEGSAEEEEVSLDVQEGPGPRPSVSPRLRDLRDLVGRHARRQLSEADLADGVGYLRNRFAAGARRLKSARPGATDLEQVLVRGTAAVMNQLTLSLDALLMAVRDGDRVAFQAALVRTEELVGILEQVYQATRVA